MLVGAVALLAVGVWADLPVPRILGGGALGALTAGVIAVRWGTRVAVRRDIHPDEVERGQPAFGRLVVTNTGRRVVPAMRAYDRVGPDARVTVDVPALAAHAAVPRTYELPTARRGALTVGPLRLRRHDALGLVSRAAQAGCVRTLWVRPRTHPVRLVAAGGGRGAGVVQAGTPFRGSVEFRSLREYVVGDEPRHVHWKSTARTGQLMVREFTDPRRPRLVVLLDNRRSALAPASFEDAVEVAASLAAAALAGGHELRLCTVDGQVVDTAARASAEVNAWLCTVRQADPSRVAVAPYATLASVGAGADVVVVTGSANGTDLAALSRVRRRVARLVVIDLAPGAGPRADGLTVITADSPAAAVAACAAVIAS